MTMDEAPGPSGPELLLALDRASARPLHEQLETTLRDHVRSGRLAPDAKVPSSRALAAALGISRGVVLEAYSQLIAEGYLVSRQGAPTRVGTTPSVERQPVPAGVLERDYRYRFDPGLPDLAAFPRDQWGRSLRVALRDAPFAALGHGDPRGEPALRNELMAYLGRVSGAAPEPEHTLVCACATAGLAALCRTLRARGVDRVAVEEPGWNRHRAIAEAAGLEPVGIPVDEHGLVVEALAESGAEVVIVTPAHQFPTGAVMSSERRSALLEWAEDEDALIVEDDYDSELRYDRVAVGALQGLAPERVLQIGSASKRLAPGRADRVDARAFVAERRADLRAGGRRRSPAGARAARARGLPRARRARPSPAADAPALPRAPRSADRGLARRAWRRPRDWRRGWPVRAGAAAERCRRARADARCRRARGRGRGAVGPRARGRARGDPVGYGSLSVPEINGASPRSSMP